MAALAGVSRALEVAVGDRQAHAQGARVTSTRARETDGHWRTRKSWLRSAGGRATIAVEEVAVVAIFSGLKVAIAAGRRAGLIVAAAIATRGFEGAASRATGAIREVEAIGITVVTLLSGFWGAVATGGTRARGGSARVARHQLTVDATWIEDAPEVAALGLGHDTVAAYRHAGLAGNSADPTAL